MRLIHIDWVLTKPPIGFCVLRVFRGSKLFSGALKSLRTGPQDHFLLRQLMRIQSRACTIIVQDSSQDANGDLRLIFARVFMFSREFGGFPGPFRGYVASHARLHRRYLLRAEVLQSFCEPLILFLTDKQTLNQLKQCQLARLHCSVYFSGAFDCVPGLYRGCVDRHA